MATKQELEDFVKKFADNFGPCWCCDGTGIGQIGDACRICSGTGLEVTAMGVLLAELKPEADRLLGRVQS